MLVSGLSLMVVGDGGRRWEFLGDSGRLEGGDRGRVGRGAREGTAKLGEVGGSGMIGAFFSPLAAI